MAAEKKEKQTSRLGEFFTGVRAEFQRISWPDRVSVGRQTTAVVCVSVITGALIALLDYAFELGMNFLFTL
ncbi:MAG: preprotein translocase subunit SecE [Lachnospiraceae bacterium]|nr:preprotein translocase subunit SecE [Lachnospiraceae bacterium]